MSAPRVIIIGAGLGGLVCGRILSRSGCDVTLLEQGGQAGGALQTFVRDGIRFDTGFHAVAGLESGGPLDRCFQFLGLEGLPWIRAGADEIIGGTEPFLRLSSGWEEERQHVLEPYRKGIWRLSGGGKTLVDALARDQQILLHKRVTAIGGRSVTCADGSVYKADIVVSDIHPLVTMRMVRDPFRPAYRHHLERMQNGLGIFTVYAKLRPGAMPWLDHSIFLNGELMIHFGEPAEDGTARSLSLLAFGPAVMSGPERTACAESLIRKAARRLPDLPGALEKYWTSTPQTWERYTGTPGGSAYGICKHGREDFLPPQTPIPWLYLTGQNIGLHGVLGTTVSALNTCKSIVL